MKKFLFATLILGIAGGVASAKGISPQLRYKLKSQLAQSAESSFDYNSPRAGLSSSWLKINKMTRSGDTVRVETSIQKGAERFSRTSTFELVGDVPDMLTHTEWVKDSPRGK
jgi:hypothetical protein